MGGKYTPGPWGWQTKPSRLGGDAKDIIIYKDNRIIAEMICPIRENALDDVRLIVNAPDLLKVLTQIKDFADLPEWLRVRVDEVIAQAGDAR